MIEVQQELIEQEVQSVTVDTLVVTDKKYKALSNEQVCTYETYNSNPSLQYQFVTVKYL